MGLICLELSADKLQTAKFPCEDVLVTLQPQNTIYINAAQMSKCPQPDTQTPLLPPGWFSYPVTPQASRSEIQGYFCPATMGYVCLHTC